MCLYNIYILYCDNVVVTRPEDASNTPATHYTDIGNNLL